MRFVLHLPKDIVIGFSGGKDSIAVAHFLKFRFRRNVTLVHVNNKLPGDDWIATRAAAFADNFGFDFGVIESPAEPTELSCRQARIRAFQGYKQVILAHHLSDAVESYLRRVCFTGNPGHQPILFRSKWNDTEVLRPFLTTSQKEIQDYLTRNNLRHWIVKDHLSVGSDRHWMRQNLAPAIERYGLETVVKKIILKQLRN